MVLEVYDVSARMPLFGHSQGIDFQGIKFACTNFFIAWRTTNRNREVQAGLSIATTYEDRATNVLHVDQGDCFGNVMSMLRHDVASYLYTAEIQTSQVLFQDKGNGRTLLPFQHWAGVPTQSLIHLPKSHAAIRSQLCRTRLRRRPDTHVIRTLT